MRPVEWLAPCSLDARKNGGWYKSFYGTRLWPDYILWYDTELLVGYLAQDSSVLLAWIGLVKGGAPLWPQMWESTSHLTSVGSVSLVPTNVKCGLAMLVLIFLGCKTRAQDAVEVDYWPYMYIRRHDGNCLDICIKNQYILRHFVGSNMGNAGDFTSSLVAFSDYDVR